MTEENTSLIVAEFDQFESKMLAFQGKYDNVVYDLDDPTQDKQARSDRLAIGKVVSSLDSTHKALKAPLKAQTDLIDAERKRIKDSLLVTQNKIKSQIAEHERKIQEHAEELQGLVEDIEAIAVFGAMDRIYLSQTDTPDSATLKARLEDARKVNVDDRFEHRKADATLAQVDTTKKLEAMLKTRLAYESEQAELAQLKKEKEDREQKEREDKIAADAKAEEARKSQQAIEDAETAKQKAIDDAAQAEADQKQELNDAEERHANELAEAQEKADAKARKKIEKEQGEELAAKKKDDDKKARTTHRNKIHKAAKASLIKLGWSEGDATLIVTQLKDELIENASINY